MIAIIIRPSNVVFQPRRSSLNYFPAAEKQGGGGQNFHRNQRQLLVIVVKIQQFCQVYFDKPDIFCPVLWEICTQIKGSSWSL